MSCRPTACPCERPALLATPPFGPSAVRCLLCRLLTSPPRSRALLPTAQSGMPDRTGTSQGKTDRLRRTPPDLPPRPSMAVDFAITCSLVRPGWPRYPVLVHRAAALLHASFRPRLTATPLRLANPSPPSGWIEDFHLQAVSHARHTKNWPGTEVPGLVQQGGFTSGRRGTCRRRAPFSGVAPENLLNSLLHCSSVSTHISRSGDDWHQKKSQASHAVDAYRVECFFSLPASRASTRPPNRRLPRSGRAAHGSAPACSRQPPAVCESGGTALTSCGD